MKGPWKIVYTPDALKDKRKAYESGLGKKLRNYWQY
jgi:hypothetical protein